MFKAYRDYLHKNNIKAMASRCWPDFFTDFGTPVCGVLGLLKRRTHRRGMRSGRVWRAVDVHRPRTLRSSHVLRRSRVD
ncbi:MAG: hypothetical protein MZU97_17850 [Bacillus subtilis]|nr:hypothetical protein [Bacillus subtilis]